MKFEISDYPCSINIRLLECNAKYYEIIGLLKDDDIYLIRYKPTGNQFVLKITHCERHTDITVIENHMNITNWLKHVNIMPFLATFVENNQLWTVMPFTEYGSVDSLSKPTGMGEKAIGYVVRDVLNALNYLHSNGIIHRAVRASHILVCAPNGDCILTGLQYSTTRVDHQQWHTDIHQYPILAENNLNWFAPEVIEQNLLGYDEKSDIYSLGITCCELANASIPFTNLQPTEMLLDKLQGNFPRPLDSTCDEFKTMSTEDLTIELQQKISVYKKRKFSSQFHKFTVDHCLNFCPNERPSASKLLEHKFIKQSVRKSTNLLKLIPNAKPMITTKPLKRESIATKPISAVNWDFS